MNLILKKYLKNEAKWENEYQLHNEIKKFQQMRMSNQATEEGELREVLDKCSRSRTQNQTGAAAAASYDSDDELGGGASRVAMDSDEEEAAAATAKKASGRGGGRGGRGSRGARGGASTRGRGRGAAAAAATQKVTQSAAKRSQILNLDDSDNDILEVESGRYDDDEDECTRGTNPFT